MEKMFSPRKAIQGFALFWIFALSACQTSSSIPCKAGDLTAPVVLSPTQGIVLEGEGVNFLWDFNPACAPDFFMLEFGRNDQFQYGGIVEQRVDGDEKSWKITEGLVKAEEYYWRVRAEIDGQSSPWSEVGYFITGPYCEGSLLPRFSEIGSIHPPDGRSFPPGIFKIRWRQGENCLLGGVYLEIFTDSEMDDLIFEKTIKGFSQNYILEENLPCGIYYWRLTPFSIKDEYPNFEFFFASQLFEFEYPDGCTSEDPQELNESIAKVIYDSPCRRGPDQDYPLVRYVFEGNTVNIIARNNSNTWLLVPGADIEMENCWVADIHLEITEDLSHLPVYIAPPLNADGESSAQVCQENLSKDECETAGGEFKTTTYPPCKCP